MEKLEHPYIVDENEKWHAYLGKQLAVSYKVKHKLIIRPSNPIPRYLSKRNENIPT